MKPQEELKLFAEFNGAEWLQGLEVRDDGFEVYIRWTNNGSSYQTIQGFPALLVIQGAAMEHLRHHWLHIDSQNKVFWLDNVGDVDGHSLHPYPTYTEAIIDALKEARD